MENIFRRDMLNPKASVFNTITGNIKRDIKTDPDEHVWSDPGYRLHTER